MTLSSAEDGVRRYSNTSEASGHREELPSQQRCINIHRSSVKVGCVGLGGRSPRNADSMAIKDEQPLNGAAPVNTCIGTKCQ